jgi:hypothetical protein
MADPKTGRWRTYDSNPLRGPSSLRSSNRLRADPYAAVGVQILTSHPVTVVGGQEDEDRRHVVIGIANAPEGVVFKCLSCPLHIGGVRTRSLAFIPWAPVAQGGLAGARQTLADIARAHQCPVGQVAIAWLLHLSPAMLLIPGTSRRTHLEENLAAADVQLTTEQIDELSAAAS